MQLRYVKDFAIALIVIMLLAFGIRLYTVYFQVTAIPDKSIHSKESVSDTLLNKIKGIETSIQERKNFVFSNTRDPLRQGNIIKDKMDLEKEFDDMIRNTFRLSTTAIDENGNKIAYIEYQGAIHAARIGETIQGRRIVDIGEKTIRYFYAGNTYSTELASRPPMPDFNKPGEANTSGNW
ncbi:MAG: hypothetical protein Q8J62_04090 [Candidatus Cloacimonadaceae bacterium]|nr:hypothetical protein [Candidatus Cloacimonadaceae bacterium]